MNEQLKNDLSNLIKSQIYNDDVHVFETYYSSSNLERLYHTYKFIVAEKAVLNKINFHSPHISEEIKSQIKLDISFTSCSEEIRDYISFYTNDKELFNKIIYSNHKKIYNKIEKAFFEIADKYKVFEKIETKDIFDEYYFLSNQRYSPKIIQTKRVFYRDSYRQQKSENKKENKSSYLETCSIMSYDQRNNRFRQHISVKLPFLYKSKINLNFYSDEFDLDKFKIDIEENYKKLIVNHIKNKLKKSININKKEFDFNNLEEYLNLINVFKY